MKIIYSSSSPITGAEEGKNPVKIKLMVLGLGLGEGESRLKILKGIKKTSLHSLTISKY